MAETKLSTNCYGEFLISATLSGDQSSIKGEKNIFTFEIRDVIDNTSDNFIKNKLDGGAWMTQSFKRAALDFGSGQNFRIQRLSSVSGSTLGVGPA